jgi:hypothetical protein
LYRNRLILLSPVWLSADILWLRGAEMSNFEPRAVLFLVFLIGLFINLAIETWLGRWVRGSIRGLITRIAVETYDADVEKQKRLQSTSKHYQQPDPIESVEQRVDRMGGNELFGATIGLVERSLYLYALTYGVIGILQAVIVFKGFAGWVTVGATSEKHGSKILSHFYGYTIGNLFSIALAIGCYEMSVFIYYLLTRLPAWPLR